MGFKKKIAALGAAVVMTVSMSAMEVSAASRQAFYFELYYKSANKKHTTETGYYPRESKIKSSSRARIVYIDNKRKTDVKVKLKSGANTYTKYYSKRRYGDYDTLNVMPNKRYKTTASLYNFNKNKSHACDGWVEDDK